MKKKLADVTKISSAQKQHSTDKSAMSAAFHVIIIVLLLGGEAENATK